MAGLVTGMDVLARACGASGRPPLWMIPIMFILGLAFVGLFLWAVYMMIRHFYRFEIVPRKYPAGDALAIAQRRYASGEISGDEFEKIKQAIQVRQ